MPLNTVMQNIRPPAIAGTFYPSNPHELKVTVKYFLNEAEKYIDNTTIIPKAIIAPHAGYIYSGLTAAAVYNRLKPAREKIKRVVILGPCHRVATKGLALPSAEIFQTPLGDVHIDTDAIASIKDLDYVEIFNETHAEDHSIEIHLPFLQTILDSFKLVPLIVGDTNPEKVAEILDILWGGPETLILISSDLSHYLNYNQATLLDRQTCKAIEQMNPNAIGREQACGRHSIKGLLMLGKEKGLVVKIADMRNSGDTAGTKDRVVGYGSWYFEENYGENNKNKAEAESAMSDILEQHGEKLLRLAASAIFSQLLHPETKNFKLPILNEVLTDTGASFITLSKKDQLRGCIGSLQATKPLIKDIIENACKAAFEDPRFPRLTIEEVRSGDIEISISILSSQTQIYFSNEADLLSKLQPGIDGIILKEGTQCRSVFLPSVWEQIPSPKQFINHLKLKAGLPEDYWSNTIEAWRYTTKSKSSINLPSDQPLWPTKTLKIKK